MLAVEVAKAKTGPGPGAAGTEDEKAREVPQGEPTCGACIHRELCRVSAGFGLFFATLAKEMKEPPIAPEDLAKICREFKPVWIITGIPAPPAKTIVKPLNL